MTDFEARRRPVLRWVALATGVVGGAYLARPWILARVFAPPQRPNGSKPADFDLAAEDIWLESANGTLLHAWFIPGSEPGPAVLVLHGWGGNSSFMLPLAPPLHRAGFSTMFLDARNHGLSEHDNFSSMPRFAEDLDVAIGWLRSRSSVTSVGVIGHSVGAGAAILSASRSDEIDAVVSVSAPSHPGELMREQMSRLPGPVLDFLLETVQHTIGHRFEAFAPRHRVALVDVPLLLVHGEDDRVVPVFDVHELAAAQPAAEVLVVQGAGHSELAPFAGHVGDIIGFFGRHLS